MAEYNEVTVAKTSPQSDAPAFELTFVTEDIEATFKQAVEAGAVVVKDPSAKPWGQVVGYIRDCNGFLVELCTPVEG